MKIAMLAPIAWRTPPRHYGPWERVTSLLTEALVDQGHEVTLFATGESQTRGRLESVINHGYEEDTSIDPKVWECLHISHCFEQADSFDIIHNQFDFLPLTYSQLVSRPMVTTIHGFSSPNIIPVFIKYNMSTWYVSISDADRNPELDYIDTIYHGIDIQNFTFNPKPKDNYLLYFGRIHHDKGTAEAITIAHKAQIKLIIAGIIQDTEYYTTQVKPFLEPGVVEYVGSADPKMRNTLLGGAIALLHPINFSEPFGLSVVESMACGTPVIAFKKGSMNELIQHGKSGYTVNTVDEAVACVRTITDIKRDVCREVVENKFTVEVMVKNYIRVYKKILASHQRR